MFLDYKKFIKIKYLLFFTFFSLLIYFVIEVFMASYTLHESQHFVDKINYKNYKKSSQNILYIFKEPFIAIHAVYSKEKLYKYIRKYKGIETDIVYKNNNFYIAHDDIENIEKYTIKLNNIFAYINEFKDTNMIYGGGNYRYYG